MTKLNIIADTVMFVNWEDLKEHLNIKHINKQRIQQALAKSFGDESYYNNYKILTDDLPDAREYINEVLEEQEERLEIHPKRIEELDLIINTCDDEMIDYIMW